MPSFKYKALNRWAHVSKGEIVADNQDQAIEELKKKCLHPIHIEEVDPRDKDKPFWKFW